MSEEYQLEVRPPHSGSSTVSFSAGDQGFWASIDDLRPDSIGNFVHCVANLTRNSTHERCVLSDDESETTLLIFRQRAGRLSLRALRYYEFAWEPDEGRGRELFSQDALTLKRFARLVHGQLRQMLAQLGEEGYRRERKYPFPSEAYETIERYLEGAYGRAWNEFQVG